MAIYVGGMAGSAFIFGGMAGSKIVAGCDISHFLAGFFISVIQLTETTGFPDLFLANNHFLMGLSVRQSVTEICTT